MSAVIGVGDSASGAGDRGAVHHLECTSLCTSHSVMTAAMQSTFSEPVAAFICQRGRRASPTGLHVGHLSC